MPNETFSFADEPTPEVKQPLTQSPQLEKLLDWLVNHWPRPTISVADICTYGPRPRNRNRAVELAEILTKYRWLEPLKTHRRDRQEWKIIRGPTPIPLTNRISTTATPADN
jgi:hypothetical protein